MRNKSTAYSSLDKKRPYLTFDLDSWPWPWSWVVYATLCLVTILEQIRSYGMVCCPLRASVNITVGGGCHLAPKSCAHHCWTLPGIPVSHLNPQSCFRSNVKSKYTSALCISVHLVQKGDSHAYKLESGPLRGSIWLPSVGLSQNMAPGWTGPSQLNGQPVK